MTRRNPGHPRPVPAVELQSTTPRGEHSMSTVPIARHIAADGETFRPDPRAPLRLEVVIDNQDARDAEHREWPYTISAYLTDPDGSSIPIAVPLILGNGDAAIGASIPQMLRDLAALIESGEVYA